jgi:PKD repeat protein
MKISRLILVPAFVMLISGGCYKNEPVPSALFSVTGSNNFKIPCIATFTNNSVNSFSWAWNFGDDSVSALQNPVHIYLRPGQYPVTLRAYTQSRKEWSSLTQTVVIKDTIQ